MMYPETDRQLVKRSLKGDKDSFTQLILNHEKTLYGTAMGIVKNSHDASDAIQDAILEAYENLDSLREPNYFKTWLIRILIHKCYAILKRSSRQIPTEFTEESLGCTEDTSDTAMDIRNAMDTLSGGDRLILTLFYVEDIPIKEIASMLELSQGAVKNRLYRSRTHFKEIYCKEGIRHEPAKS